MSVCMYVCMYVCLYMCMSRHTSAGMVLANDADPKRAYMLVHQLKRLGSANFLVTTHEGQFFPNLRVRDVRDACFQQMCSYVPERVVYMCGSLCTCV